MGFNAVVLAIGAHKSRSLGIPGEDKAGVINALISCARWQPRPGAGTMAARARRACRIYAANTSAWWAR